MQNLDSKDILSTLYKSEKASREAHRFELMKKYNHAGPLFQEALELKQKALGADDPGVAQSMDDLGAHCLRTGDYQKADDLFKRAIAILEKAYYADHGHIAPVASHLGDCYGAQNKWEDAEAAYKRALDIYSKTLVADHHDILESTRKLAIAQRKQGKNDEAETLLKKAVKGSDTPLGPLEEFYFELALTQQAAGKNDDAAATFKDALRLFEQRDKPHREADCLDSYAKLLRATDKTSQAERLEKRARMLRENFQDNLIDTGIYPATLMRA